MRVDYNFVVSPPPTQAPTAISMDPIYIIPGTNSTYPPCTPYNETIGWNSTDDTLCPNSNLTIFETTMIDSEIVMNCIHTQETELVDGITSNSTNTTDVWICTAISSISLNETDASSNITVITLDPTTLVPYPIDPELTSVESIVPTVFVECTPMPSNTTIPSIVPLDWRYISLFICNAVIPNFNITNSTDGNKETSTEPETEIGMSRAPTSAPAPTQPPVDYDKPHSMRFHETVVTLKLSMLADFRGKDTQDNGDTTIPYLGSHYVITSFSAASGGVEATSPHVLTNDVSFHDTGDRGHRSNDASRSLGFHGMVGVIVGGLVFVSAVLYAMTLYVSRSSKTRYSVKTTTPRSVAPSTTESV